MKADERRVPFAPTSDSILAERMPELGRRLRSGEQPTFILLLGCGAGRGLLGLSQSFPTARISAIAEDDFSLLLTERLLKDRPNVQVLKLDESKRRFSDLSRSYDLIVVEQGSAKDEYSVGDLISSLRSGGALLLFDEARPTRLSNFEEGIVSCEAKSTRFWLGRK
ncbi:MAG: hypothetical protein ACRECH_01425 [Nitrososphaerales archaeon]